MSDRSATYNAIKTRHTNPDPTNLVWVSECLSQAEGSDFDGPVLFGTEEEARRVWRETGGDEADLDENGTHEIVEVTITILEKS